MSEPVNELEIARLGDHIRSIRTAQKLSRSDLADRCNCSQATIRYVEEKGENPKIGTIQSIAQAFGLTLVELLQECENLDQSSAFSEVNNDDDSGGLQPQRGGR